MREIDQATVDSVTALRVADFPLLLDDGSSEYTAITSSQHYGREGLMPVSAFAPTVYETWEGRNYRTAKALTDTLFDNVFYRAVLERNLGPHFDHLRGYVLVESVYLSVIQHQADLLVSAARFMVDAESPKETWVAVWDNGRPYNSAEALEARMTKDTFRDLGKPKELHAGNHPDQVVAPTIIVNGAVDVLKGTLSVLSGTNRLDIGKNEDGYTFTHSQIPAIVGNLLVARMPHISDEEHEEIIRRRYARI